MWWRRKATYRSKCSVHYLEYKTVFWTLPQLNIRCNGQDQRYYPQNSDTHFTYMIGPFFLSLLFLAILVPILVYIYHKCNRLVYARHTRYLVVIITVIDTSNVVSRTVSFYSRWTSLVELSAVQLRIPDITYGLFRRQEMRHFFRASMNAALCDFWYEST